MAGPFRSDKESQKWAYLEATSKQSFDRVKAGTASKFDYQKVGQVLDQYDKLSKSIFDNALESMEQAAVTVVDAIEKDREKKGKAPLTEESADKLFNLALQRSFHDFGPELVETIDALLTKRLDDQDELTGFRFEDAVEKIHKFIPKQPEAKDTEKVWDERLDEFAGRAEKAFRKSIVEVAKELRQQVARHPDEAPTNSVSGGLPALTGPKKQSIIDKLRSRISSTARAARTGASALIGRSKTFAAGLTLASPKAEHDVVENQKKQSTTLESLNATLQKFIKGSRQVGKVGQERLKRTFAGMLKKYDSMRNFFKDRWHGMKMRGKELMGGMGWASKLAKGALIGLAYSPLLKYLGSKFAEVFSAENVKDVLGKWWDWSKEKAPEALDWVWDKVSNFDYKGVADKVWSSIQTFMAPSAKNLTDAKNDAKVTTSTAGNAAGRVLYNVMADTSLGQFFGMKHKYSPGSFRKTGTFSQGSGAPFPSSGPDGSISSNPLTYGLGTTTASGSYTDLSNTKGIFTNPGLPNELAGSNPAAPDPATQKPWTPEEQYALDRQRSKTTQVPSGMSRSSVVQEALGLNSSSVTRSVPSQSVVLRPPVTSTAPSQPASTTPQSGLPAINKGGKAGVMGLGSFGLMAGVDDTLGLANLGVLQ